MATGNYGTVRPADVGISDVDIFYTFTPNRDASPTIPVQRLEATNVLTPLEHPDALEGLNVVPILGLVFDKANLPSELTANDALVGYRVEYYNDVGLKIPNFFRIITSSNSAEPVNQNLQNTVQKSIRYRFNDTASLMYTTLTPSSAANATPNRIPFIGDPNQRIILTNTFFNPITIEIEMVDHDFETLAYGLFGNQIKSITDGKYTIYDFNNNIYKQYNLYEIQDEFTGEPLHEVRQETNEVDFDKNFDDITNT